MLETAKRLIPFTPRQQASLESTWSIVQGNVELTAALQRDSGILADAAQAPAYTADPALLERTLGKDWRVYPVLILLTRLPWLQDMYAQHGIGEEVLRGTLADLLIWMEDCERRTGECGLQDYGWLSNHFRFVLFAVGRLQYIVYRAQPEVAAMAQGICEGDTVLQLHIPAGAPLNTDAALASLQSAPGFFREHLHTEGIKAVVCESWLMNPYLPEIVPGSNLARFSQLFTVAKETDSDAQMFERVFDRPLDAWENMPQDTSLRRAMRAWYERGGRCNGCLAYRMI